MASGGHEQAILRNLVMEARLTEEVRRLEALIAAERDERRWQEQATRALLEQLQASGPEGAGRGNAPARLEVNKNGTPRRRKWYKAKDNSLPPAPDDDGDPHGRSGQTQQELRQLQKQMQQLQLKQQQLLQDAQMVLSVPEAEDAFAIHAARGEAETRTNADSAKNALTMKQLDLGDMYEANASIWDASMFIFHPCLGSAVSMILILIWLLNLGVQLYFCYIVYMHMLEDDVTSDRITELLRFRVSTGHNALFADSVSQRSLTAQVCMEDRRAYLAGLQMEQVDHVDEFLAGGMSLMMVAQALWICTILKELNAAWNFARSMLHLQRGSSTRLILAESSDFEESHVLEVDSDDEESILATLCVVTRVTKIRKLRLWASMAFIFVPRVLLGLVLGYIGVRFLGKTARNEDLLLNAIALAFVSEIDELFFDIFVPRRAHTLIHNLEALPMPHKRCRKSAGAHSIFKVILVGGTLFATRYLLLRPYFWMLNQAYDVVCSGEQNFVFAENPVSGLVHVAKSPDEDEWTELEKTILQLAYPSIEAQFGWDIDAAIISESTANKTRAIFMTENSLHANNISNVEYSAASFSAVMQMQMQSAAEAAMAQSCTDLNSGEVALQSLRHLMGNASIASCDDVPWQFCSNLDMLQLRALCPRRCNCDRPPLISPGYAGFFRTPVMGCPSQCASLTASYNEISYQLASPLVAMDINSVHSCTDSTDSNFIHDASQTCVNSDQFQIGVTGPAGNSQGQNCQYYYYSYWWDETSGQVLEAWVYVNLYGERTAHFQGCPTQYDDSDFTAGDMCCKCGGGYRDLNISSVSCFRELTDECATMSPPAFWFLLYVKGLFEKLHSDQFFEDTLRDSVHNPSQLIGTEFYQSEELVQSVLNGSLAELLLNGRWEFMPNHSHPRGLTGCDYLTSFEFTALLNMDLCASNEYSSLKFLCPESCGCRPTMFQNHHRNYQNIEDITSTFVFDVDPWFVAPETLFFSNDKVEMSVCPASCAVPHRALPGQGKGWNLFEQPPKEEEPEEAKERTAGAR